ncbi:MAG: hypothetical protein MJ252_29325 [archaeon]|nr:hypothetical protein [archaeon]
MSSMNLRNPPASLTPKREKVQRKPKSASRSSRRKVESQSKVRSHSSANSELKKSIKNIKKMLMGTEDIKLEDGPNRFKELEYDIRKSVCTYRYGYISQELFSCLTCAERTGKDAAICRGCAMKCHLGHKLHNINIKRHIRCDCGNSLFQGGKKKESHFECKLFKEKEDLNIENKYNHNCQAKYCYCNKEENGEPMFQCLFCEDFFHYKCLNIYKFRNFPVGVKADLICANCLEKARGIIEHINFRSAVTTKKSLSFRMNGDDYKPSGEGFFEENEDIIAALEFLGRKREGEKVNVFKVAQDNGWTLFNPRAKKRGPSTKMDKRKKIIDSEENDFEDDLSSLSDTDSYCKNIESGTAMNYIINERKDIFVDGEELEKIICRCENCKRYYESIGLGFLGTKFYTRDWKQRVLFEDSEDEIPEELKEEQIKIRENKNTNLNEEIHVESTEDTRKRKRGGKPKRRIGRRLKSKSKSKRKLK